MTKTTTLWTLVLLLFLPLTTTATTTDKDSEPDNQTSASTMSSVSTSTSLSISKIVIDSLDDIRPILSDDGSSQSSVIFFSASLSIFAAIGVVVFIRKCVRCPSRRHTRRRHFAPDPDDAAAKAGNIQSIYYCTASPEHVQIEIA